MHLEQDKNKIKNALYVVSTPIGNLNDMSFRAIEVLKNSDLILCEDTRVTKKLLTFYKIDKKLISNHKFNEKKNLKKMLELLNNSKILSLVSDAGTPSISDPGNILINECIKNNIKVIPIPGPSAVIAAVSVSGFSNNFYFQGFISDKKNGMKKELEFLSKLNNSKILSLVSDAGTPLISDPGNILINECIKKNIKIIPIPGPSAVVTAVSVSGFSNNFYFHGFLSDKKNVIKKELEFLSKLDNSIVFFVSAKKFSKLIPYLKDYFLGRKIVICKELTKYYEQIYRSNISELSEQNINLKGEITVVISNVVETKKNKETLDESVKIRIKNLMNKLTIKDIVSIIGSENNISNSAIYKYCLKLKNEK